MATTKRLIRADVTVEAFTKWLTSRYDGRMPADIVNEIPTVDAVEVVHGHWIFKHNPIDDPKRYFTRIVCSNCNLHTGQKSNYCPQCGAKMDGGENVTNHNKT